MPYAVYFLYCISTKAQTEESKSVSVSGCVKLMYATIIYMQENTVESHVILIPTCAFPNGVT